MCCVSYQSRVPDSEGAHRKDVVDNSEGLGLVWYPLEIWRLEYTNHIRKKHCAKRHGNAVIEVMVFLHGFRFSVNYRYRRSARARSATLCT